MVFGGFGDRESRWFAGSSVKRTRVKRLRELKRTRGERGLWMLAKGQEGLTYPQLNNPYFHELCSVAEKKGRVERAGFSEKCV